ncbi:MAG: tol-pal system protein YbgF [Halomonas sp.]|jgi:tol-pal system protein YbgF|uniref:Cell division coordinator CpoB n=1 Tax=Billgrantia tianxiuensis TaxID=2497861 RepID=A0A6I6SHK4_9GAMM|nr:MULTISPECIES: tol-pal system protein YbgF [Halomonas]MCE8031703.1 tol-pal system protein YbgF [Halomonas sp. MCCC 1A11057]MDX5434288.1 tol-pal system protein YbgF [Halomonas sp.]QHC50168.1 tol-pal system protein YbgF [Halomonas tianxiuensis]
MRHSLKRLCGAGALVLPLSVMSLVEAQQRPIVEDRTAQPRGFLEQAEVREEAGGSLVMYNQLQEHQREIQQLRGQIEELRHQLEQLRNQTRQQYLDLDERLMAGSAGIEANPQVDEESARQVAQTPSPSGNSPDAQAAYQAAFAKVQARQFGEAIAAFEAFVADYPDTSLTANGYYWLGELHSAEANLDQAEGAFRQVIDNYPQSSKVPDALYKLGLIKARQGELEQSRSLLERVRDDYPDSSAAGLANDFLRQSL